jgi:hypothetical protein
MFTMPVFSQGLRNNNYMNVSGGYLVIQGNYQNENSGNIGLDGTIQLTGNWTNNATDSVMRSTNGTGTVVFAGTGMHTIGGTGSNVFNFEGITINAGDTMQVSAGKGVTAAGPCSFNTPLILKSSDNDTAFRSRMATFINNSTVSGNITMQMHYISTNSADAGTGRGLYFSSPLSNATSTIFDVAAGNNLLWYQDEVSRKYVKIITNGTALTAAKGYILRSATSQTFSFTGAPNAADSYTKSSIPRVVSAQYYLMGNPYPAVVDWQTIATKTNLTNTVWYRTCTSKGAMRVDTWNGASTTGTKNNGTATVDGKIPPMQSFWIQVDQVGHSGTLTINKTDRSHNWGTTSFLKSAKIETKQVFRLYLYTNDQPDETIFIQSDSAQDMFDSWDSRKMLLGDASLAELYTISPDKEKLVIQSVKPVTQEKIIPIGLNTYKNGVFKFQAELNEVLEPSNYYLEDKQLKNIQNLNLNPEYTFNSGAVTDSTGSRFVLHILPQSATEIPTPSITESVKLKIYAYEKRIHIRNCLPNDFIAIYDLLGRKLYTGKATAENVEIPFNYPNGYYIVKIMGNTHETAEQIFIE